MNAPQTPLRDDPATLRDARERDALLECLVILTRLHGRPMSADALVTGLPLEEQRLTPSLFVRAAEAHGYSARVVKKRLSRISNLVLPAVLLLKDGGACVLVAASAEAAEVILPEAGMGAKTIAPDELDDACSGYVIFAHPRPRPDLIAPWESGSTGRHWLWSTLWRFRRYYAESVLGATIVNLLTLATALFVMNVYDRVVPNNATATLWVLATGTAIAIGFEFLARMLRGYLLDAAGKKADLMLAATLFRQAMAIRVEARPPSAGAFASHLREFEALRDFLTSATMTTLTDLPFVFFFTWVISLIAGPIAWIPALAVPFVLAVGLIAQIPLARTMRAHMHESSQKHGVLVEAVEGVETIKSLSAEGVMQSRWENYTALTAQSAMRSRMISSAVVNITMLTMQFATVAMVVWGVYLISEGLLTVGGLIASTILAGRALGPLGQLSGLLMRVQHALSAYSILNRLMKLPVDRPAGRSYLHRPELAGRIDFSQASFAYPNQKTPVLQDVSVAIAPGEKVAVLGRVGAGKTTLLKLAAGLYVPTSGAILVDGADLQQIDPADLRRNLGYVSQDARLFSGTLRQNVVMGAPLADDEAILAVSRIAGLDRWVGAHPLGFDMPIGEQGEGISGGQRQAVAIARALLQGPPVLVMDEPTSSMDHNTEETLIRYLKTFCAGRTLLIATHKPSLLALVDRLVVLDGGRVVADGPRDVVLKALARPQEAQP